MEALTAVQVGLLTVYDMCKAVDRGMVMADIRLLEKRGGKSGDWGGRRLSRRHRHSAQVVAPVRPASAAAGTGRAAASLPSGASQAAKNSSAYGLRNSRRRCARCRALSSSPARASAWAQAIISRVSSR